VFTDIKHIKPLPGMIRLLEEIYQKVPLAIVTNGPSIYAKKVIRINKLKKYFKTIQTTSKNKAKPNSEMIYKAAKKLGVKVKECIVIDDGKVGIEAGKKAGCKTIYFSKNKDVKSNYYAKNALELKKIILKLI
jgi:HAD superfamily hydrolase (TIGR01509 family)